MNNYTVRLCNENDIEDIYGLQKKWFIEDITYGFIPDDREYLKAKIGDYFYVAEINEIIIGFIFGTIHESKDLSIFPDGTKYIEIDDVYMDFEYRDTGIGGILLDTILETGQMNGIEKSLVYSATKDSKKIMNFYKKHGYRTWFVQMFK